jgi:hypothetical protein
LQQFAELLVEGLSDGRLVAAGGARRPLAGIGQATLSAGGQIIRIANKQVKRKWLAMALSESEMKVV